MTIIVERKGFDPKIEVSKDPLINELLQKRGIVSQEEAEFDFGGLLHYQLLLNIDHLIDTLVATIMCEQPICIVGDYDVDGATSIALMMRAMTDMGVKNLSYFVPNRFTHGYGLSIKIIDAVLERGDCHLIMTVDNGITSVSAVDYANQKGLEVLITDHHLAGEQLPKAKAIVNPNQPTCSFPCKALSGCGVSFYVMLALRAKLREKQWFDKKKLPIPNMADYLDLVAIGTVADLVPMSRNNRILVQQGMMRIRQGICLQGIQALMQVAKIESKKIQTSDIAFKIAPRLNAAGRLNDMSIGVRCLLSDSLEDAMVMGKELDQLNQQRRLIESSMQDDAELILQSILPEDKTYGICVLNKEWHEGVIGIVASRLKEKYHQPVAVFTAGEQQGFLKASLRSIPGIHLKDLLNTIASVEPGLMIGYGGHAMAAGVSIEEKDFGRFQQQFQSLLGHQKDLHTQPSIETDGCLPSQYWTTTIAKR